MDNGLLEVGNYHIIAAVFLLALFRFVNIANFDKKTFFIDNVFLLLY